MIKLEYPDFWSKRGLASFMLIPLAWVYKLLGLLRKRYTTCLKLSAKVVCVGNISVGGTGKTQVVLWLANILKQKDINFIIITKGYGSTLRGAKLVTKNDKPLEVGDESILLSEFAPVIAAQTITSALPIINSINPEIIIMDDGMQNPNFYKDITILTIDSIRDIGNGRIFPAGPLREPVESALQKSDMIFMVGNKPCNNFSLISDILNSKKPLFHAQIKLLNKLDTKGKYSAFTGIGNPDKFYSLLEENDVILAKKTSYPDHHIYSEQEIKELVLYAKKNNYNLITTGKDYVKILNSYDIICTNVMLAFEKEQELINLIYEQIRQKN